MSAGADAQRLVKETVDRFGRLDILVNNAETGMRDVLLLMMSEEAWDVVIGTNLKSAYNCCKSALRPMFKQRYGRIVNITSVAGRFGRPGGPDELRSIQGGTDRIPGNPCRRRKSDRAMSRSMPWPPVSCRPP